MGVSVLEQNPPVSVSVSLIVPVYNVEPYLRACLDSIACQTFRDFELVLIDDGSTDQSWTIAQDFVASCTVRCICLRQENCGQAVARNKGIRAALGKYICFVDSDDVIEANYLQILIENMLVGCDLAVSGFTYINESGKHLTRGYIDYVPPAAILDGLDERASTIVCSPCSKLFSREIIEKQQLQFPEGLWFEDFYFTRAYISYCRKIITIPQATYRYRQRSGSTMHSSENRKNLDIILIMEALHQHFLQRNMPEPFMQSMSRVYLNEYFFTAYRLIQGGGKKHMAALTQGIEPLLSSLPQEKNKLASSAKQFLRLLLQKGWLRSFCFVHNIMITFAAGKLWRATKKISR